MPEGKDDGRGVRTAHTDRARSPVNVRTCTATRGFGVRGKGGGVDVTNVRRLSALAAALSRVDGAPTRALSHFEGTRARVGAASHVNV